MIKKHFVSDVISLIIIIFNLIGVICFLLPPGREYYLPPFIMDITTALSVYTVFGLGISGIVGVILNITAIMIKKPKQLTAKINIVYMILFALTIPLSWLLFNVAMSV